MCWRDLFFCSTFLSNAIVDWALMEALSSITTSVGSCALTTPLILTLCLPLLVLISLFWPFFIQPCAQCVLCCGWVSWSVINGGFSGIFGEFCLNHPQELILLCFIGFAGKRHCIALGFLYTKSSRRRRCCKPLRLYVTLYVAWMYSLTEETVW